MLIKHQKVDNNLIKNIIRDHNNKNYKIDSNMNNHTYQYDKYKTNLFKQNNNGNKANVNFNKSNTIEGNKFTNNLNQNSTDNSGNKYIHLNMRNNMKEKKINENKNYIINNNRSEENQSFNTKYDYILQKSKNSNGPVEIPPDLDIQRNLNQKEWTIEKNKINENVKRSDIIKKVKIFNNKKNNLECSNLLKKMKENEKQLIIFPYVKEKQKINKTIHAIGHSNGVTYLKTSLLSGGNENYIYNNFMNKIRNDEKKSKKLIKKKMRLNLLQNQYNNKTELNMNVNNK